MASQEKCVIKLRPQTVVLTVRLPQLFQLQILTDALSELEVSLSPHKHLQIFAVILCSRPPDLNTPPMVWFGNHRGVGHGPVP